MASSWRREPVYGLTVERSTFGAVGEKTCGGGSKVKGSWKGEWERQMQVTTARKRCLPVGEPCGEVVERTTRFGVPHTEVRRACDWPGPRQSWSTTSGIAQQHRIPPPPRTKAKKCTSAGSTCKRAKKPSEDAAWRHGLEGVDVVRLGETQQSPPRPASWLRCHVRC